MRIAVVAAFGVLASACATPATPTALAASFTETFAGLYAGQQAQLGRIEVTAAALQADSRCRRSSGAADGPGEDWVCLVRYADGDTTATQSFEVQVKPDGCWKAEGPPSTQPAMLTDPVTGRLSVNQLAEFDGCLDTSWH